MPPRCVLPCPPCDAPAQVLLWTSALYAIWEVRSIGNMPHSGRVTLPLKGCHLLAASDGEALLKAGFYSQNRFRACSWLLWDIGALSLTQSRVEIRHALRRDRGR